jgi:hypothetical protein
LPALHRIVRQALGGRARTWGRGRGRQRDAVRRRGAAVQAGGLLRTWMLLALVLTLILLTLLLLVRAGGAPSHPRPRLTAVPIAPGRQPGRFTSSLMVSTDPDATGTTLFVPPAAGLRVTNGPASASRTAPIESAPDPSNAA